MRPILEKWEENWIFSDPTKGFSLVNDRDTIASHRKEQINGSHHCKQTKLGNSGSETTKVDKDKGK